MSEAGLETMTFQQKEKRLDEILGRLDKPDTSVNELEVELTMATQLT